MNLHKQGVIGLLGGSFNPAHEGHLYISEEAIKRAGLSGVWWLVSPGNPLKPVEKAESYARRLQSAQKITRGHRQIKISELERQLGTRFTVDSLRKIARRFPRRRFVWLMGADNLRQIDKWKGWVEIFNNISIIVLNRAPYAHSALRSKAALRFRQARLPARLTARSQPSAWSFIHLRAHPQSSTAIRAKGLE